MERAPEQHARASPAEPGADPLDAPAAHPGFRTGTWLWLLRHGEVHGEFHGRAYGAMDVPLSEQGERDTQAAIRAFARIPVGRVVSSSLQRARRLGLGLATSCGAAFEPTPELAEIHRGAWQGLAIADLMRERGAELAGFQADPWRFDQHGGETDRDVLRRAWPQVERAVRGSPGTAVITCHYNVIRVLATRMLGLPPARSFRLRVDLSAACLFEDGPDGWRLLRSNVKGPDPWPPRR